MDIATLITALLSALVGGGGAAAYIRARGQNTTDFIALLTTRIGNLETRIYEIDFRNTNLVIENARCSAAIANLELDIKQLIASSAARQVELDQLRAEKHNYISTIEEMARARQQMQVMQAQNDYLNSESQSLHLTNLELRAALQLNT